MNNTDKLAKVALKKSLLKEFSNSQNDRIVYLNNGDEFQIQFFNPFTYTIAAEIYLNNQVLSNKIVIRPGERIWLERYLDSPRKFKFDVYEVNNSEQVREAIANNGDIKINFYAERSHTSWTSSSITVNDWDYFNSAFISGCAGAVEKHIAGLGHRDFCDSLLSGAAQPGKTEDGRTNVKRKKPEVSCFCIMVGDPGN